MGPLSATSGHSITTPINTEPENKPAHHRLVVNGIWQLVQAALVGAGLAYTLEDAVEEYVEDGRLVQVLHEWCPGFAGFHLYNPSRWQP